MDYFVGSVAALISGNVTPSRPKLIRRALTPTKHPMSPNVTPKSEFVEDRSIFLSPTQQKKKAIVKKSPKRIFQNPDLDVTDNKESVSPKAEKVKKHLKDELEAEDNNKSSNSSKKSPSNKLNKSIEPGFPSKKAVISDTQMSNENSPKKKKRKSDIAIESLNNEELDIGQSGSAEVATQGKSPKQKKKRKSIEEAGNIDEPTTTKTIVQETKSQKKNRKRKNKNKQNKEIKNTDKEIKLSEETTEQSPKQKNRKIKKINNKNVIAEEQGAKNTKEVVSEDLPSKKVESKTDLQSIEDDVGGESDDDNEDSSDDEVSNIANPNAITEKDSDSEHESDNEIESENEDNEDTKTVEPAESSDEDTHPKKAKQKEDKSKEKKKKAEEEDPEEVIKRTLFVGNVPFSSKCKKEIKKIFTKYGDIETVRIRTVPVKDARVTPKLAIIKNEIHPERSTVNVYIKFAHPDSVQQALAENNTVLNGHHLRVSRSGESGVEHSPQLAVFLGNLPFGLEDDVLRAKFEKCGPIHSVRIVRDKKTNAGKGFGYVNFESKDGVELALLLQEEDLTIKNRIIRVKRCTNTNKPKKNFDNKPVKGNSNFPKQGQNKFGNNQNRVSNNQGQNRNFGNNQGQNRNFGNNQGQNRNFGNNQGHNRNFGNNQGQNRNFGNNQGQNRNFGNNQGQNRNFGNQQRNQGPRNFDNKSGQGNEASGASRRIMNKRPHQESGDGPPNKKQNLNEPKEKKQRKEFVGITAEKKKKQKFDKTQKKKKAISEILAKK